MYNNWILNGLVGFCLKPLKFRVKIFQTNIQRAVVGHKNQPYSPDCGPRAAVWVPLPYNIKICQIPQKAIYSQTQKRHDKQNAPKKA